MRMRIGIMTMQRVTNYGSYMQALALKNMLEEIGNVVIFIDFKEEMLASTRKYYNNSRLKILRLAKRSIKVRLKEEKRPLTQRDLIFQEAYHMIGVPIDRKYRTKVDVLVIGSDEVFNCLQEYPGVGYSLELFGKNNRAKKLISYAASFGDTTFERLQQYGFTDEISYYLKRFNALSVRDKNSKYVVEKLIGSVPLEHLDPTLVGGIEKMNWKKCSNKGYVAVYGYGNRFSKEEGAAIKDFAHKRNMDIVILNAPQKFAKDYILCKPDEIFGYFQNADYIVTDTFHGTIFSVLFHKPVAVFSRSPQDVDYSNENKLLDLVERLGIESQLVQEPSELEDILLHEIDYNRIDTLRQKERIRTINYLKEYCCE